MDSTPPPWRVFDAPPSTATPSTDQGERAGRALPIAPNSLMALAGAAGLAVLAVVIALGGMPGTSPEAAAASGELPIRSDAAAGVEVVVDVAGAVARPGVYHLPGGSRIGDAIAAAGGFGPRVAADRVDAELNLAALVHDGDRVLVPSRDAAASGATGSGTGTASRTTGPGGLVDLNHATREQLDTLPGIGLVTADKIIASRAEKPFTAIEEIRDRGLVGQKAFDRLRPLITVG